MTTEPSSVNTKVARVIRAYDLDGMGANLEAAWTGASGERTSLRDLADEFNEAVLRAALGEAGTSTFGLIQSGGLETSNVDISQQLVRLITAQRNFQASSRVISTNDQITQTAINLGR